MSTGFKQVKNNVKTRAAANSLNNVTSSGTFSVTTGDGAKFPAITNGYWITVWDDTIYQDPGDDPNIRIGLVTVLSSDALTVTWGQRGTPINAIPGTPRIAMMLIDQHLTDIHTAVNSAETNIATNTTAIAAETSRATAAEALLAPKAAPVFSSGISTTTLKLTTSSTPASASATGTAGQITWDSGFIYVCIATNSWKRVAIAAW